MNEEYFIRKERRLKQKIRDHKAEGYFLKKEIEDFLREKESYHTYCETVVKLTEEQLKKKIKQVETMLNKSKDQSASENEREVARKTAERMIKKYGLDINPPCEDNYDEEYEEMMRNIFFNNDYV